ncbi:uncharacterized protein LOC126676423 [Mercurialis annua]|uniref:uncharacterized protein LOC126676423 n=1 Tax=Mercurialis annua TaxID=3986 RepID=UPI002160F549|nr:uncharacterized protein LOC126676423 [Mercurialis annua]
MCHWICRKQVLSLNVRLILFDNLLNLSFISWEQIYFSSQYKNEGLRQLSLPRNTSMDKIDSPGKSSSTPEVEIIVNQDLPPSAKMTPSNELVEAMQNQEENPSRIMKKSIFEAWAAKTFGMMPFTFITNLFAALVGVNGGINLSSSTCKVFFVLLMINFYASVVGILLWHVFPRVAKGFHLMAFLCAMLSLTILFCTVVPTELKSMPWVFMTIVMLLVTGLLVYELSSLSKKSY